VDTWAFSCKIEFYHNDIPALKDWLIGYDKSTGIVFTVNLLTNKIEFAREIKFIRSIMVENNVMRVHWLKPLSPDVNFDEIDIEDFSVKKFGKLTAKKSLWIEESHYNEIAYCDKEKYLVVTGGLRRSIKITLRKSTGEEISSKTIGPELDDGEDRSLQVICENKKVHFLRTFEPDIAKRQVFFVDIGHFFMSENWNFEYPADKGLYSFDVSKIVCLKEEDPEERVKLMKQRDKEYVKKIFGGKKELNAGFNPNLNSNSNAGAHETLEKSAKSVIGKKKTKEKT